MIPRYLFHYTGIETAKQILLSHKIRFKRLDLLNDPYEGDFLFSDIPLSQGEKRKVIYCSCWNNEEAESINMWHIYTEMHGVRLKMKSSMFSKSLILQEQPSGFAPVGEIEPLLVESGFVPVGKIASLLVKPCEMINFKIERVYGPLKVAYVNGFEDTFDTALGKSIENAGTDKEIEMYNVNLKELGIKKVKHWEYESEWRYKVSLANEFRGSKKVMDSPFEIRTPEYIDIPFVEEIEEIQFAPLVCKKEKKDLCDFIKSNHINVTVKPSQIRYRDKKI